MIVLTCRPIPRSNVLRTFTALLLGLSLIGSISIGNADGLSLSGIDAFFIRSHLKLSDIDAVRETETADSAAPGCQETRLFSIARRFRESQLVIALCDQGPFGPNQYLTTVEEGLKPFALKEGVSEKTAAEARMIRGDVVPLGGGRSARTVWLPLLGHGLMFTPIAVALSRNGESTILIQGDFDIERDPDFLDKLGELIQGVDGKL